jgi:hypothetical protein
MVDVSSRNDPLLAPFLEATDEAIAERLLTNVIQEHAEPVISRILRTKLRVSLNGANGTQANQDALEIAAGLRLVLVNDLKALQQDATRQITSFPDYVAIKTYSACADYFRGQNPRRWRLKNALRYQLKHNSRFALWQADDNRWYAGFQEWQSIDISVDDGNSAAFDRSLLVRSKTSSDDIPLVNLLTSIFEHEGRALEFDRLVSLAADAMEIADALPQSLDSDTGAGHNQASQSPPVDIRFEQRLFLERLWTEVCELPVLQRAALLLNLRDATGGNAIFFLPYLGIASIAQIAAALEISSEQFQTIWSELPMEDAQIALRFGLTRQQVINLRKTARERLKRKVDE